MRSSALKASRRCWGLPREKSGDSLASGLALRRAARGAVGGPGDRASGLLESRNTVSGLKCTPLPGLPGAAESLIFSPLFPKLKKGELL